FFRSATHDLVTQQLLTAIRERARLGVVIGEAGVGKTTVCRVLLEELDRRTVTSFIASPSMSSETLLAQILCDFGVLSRDEIARGPLAARQESSSTLQSFVESLAPLEASALVIVDEAQNLRGDLLDEVRRLCEIAEQSSLLQIVLVGQPTLAALLKRAENRTLQQRVAVRSTLQPVRAAEIPLYIAHRLAFAGVNDSVNVEFERTAVDRIYELSRGVPRVINLLCERALVLGHESSAAVLGRALVDAAARDLCIGRRQLSVR